MNLVDKGKAASLLKSSKKLVYEGKEAEGILKCKINLYRTNKEIKDY